MKNYLKFVVIVASFTVAIFSSVNAVAKKSPSDAPAGSCANTVATCGFTPAGDVIIGTYTE